MTFLKRAYLHTTRKKTKTVLMFSILLTISTMILICLAIQSATNTAALNVRKSLMGSFTINAKQIDTQLTDSVVNQILDADGLTLNYSLRSYYQAEYRSTNGQPLDITTDGAVEIPAGYEHAGKVVGNTHSDWDTYFTEAGFELLEGRHITEGDSNVLLIHKNFAVRNGLSVGDHLVLATVGNDIERQVEVEIIGIFSSTLPQDAYGMAPSYDLYENVSFSDNRTYSQLLFEDGTGHYQYGDFYVDDPAKLDTSIANVKGLGGMDWEKCIFSKHDADYQNAKTALESLQKLVTTIIAVLIVVSTALLTLILYLWIRNRVHETGVLLAMGFSKRNILMQHFAEILMIAVIAFTMSFGTSTLVAQRVGDNLLQQASTEQITVANLTEDSVETDTTNELVSITSIDVSVSPFHLLCVYAIGIGIILLSIFLAAYPVMRMKPKDILTKMS